MLLPAVEGHAARPGGILREHGALLVILVLFVLLGILYSVITPIFEASDELWHYPFVKHLADGGGLPVQRRDQLGPWRQEGSQPPLYYALGALLTSHINTQDLDSVRQLNPHADIGVPTNDRNVNMVIHTPRERWPYRGTVLAVHLVRWMSVLLAAGTVVAAYLLARQVFPNDKLLAITSAGLTAFNPMFLFIAGSVNNDTLATMLCALCLWLAVRFIMSTPTPAQWTLLGVLLGLGSISKASALALLPLAGLAVVVVAVRQRSARKLCTATCLVLVPAVAVGGWWYWRNWTLYRDPVGLSAFVAIVGPRYPVPSLRQLLGEWKGFVMSFWGFFGGVNVAAPPCAYWLPSLMSVAGLAGVPLYLRRAHRVERPNLLFWMQLGLVIVWPFAVLAALVRWTLMTIASQGRLMFPSLTAINLLVAMGLLGWAPPRWRPALCSTACSVMLVIALLLPFVTVRPAYEPPPRLTNVDLPSAQRLDATFGDVMRLMGYGLGRTELVPGQPLAVTLYWQSLAPMQHNYSVFVHVLGANDLIIGQRDMYPGQGNYATTLWATGDTIADTYSVPVSRAALTPGEAELEVGLYRLETGERLPVKDAQGAPRGDSLRFAHLVLPARSLAGIPNPVEFNFDNRIALVGYMLDRTAAAPGESLHLTLYWKAQRDLHVNYSVFTHVLGERDRLWAQADSWPQGGNAPTATWHKGQTIVDSYDLTLAADTPPGVCDVEVGLYGADGKRLTLLGPGGHAQDTRVLLAKVRTLPAP